MPRSNRSGGKETWGEGNEGNCGRGVIYERWIKKKTMLSKIVNIFLFIVLSSLLPFQSMKYFIFILRYSGFTK